MNIKRFIDQNRKIIGYIVIIIVFALFAIKSLNLYYENDERRKKEQANEIAANNQTNKEEVITEKDYSTTSNSIEKTMASFVNYCNKKEIENAYEMLTDECKNAMFPTVEHFEKYYINKIYNVEREYELIKWSAEGNISTYFVKLYGDILATGNLDDSTDEYYTFVKDSKGNYKLNVADYIYGQNRNIETKSNGLVINIGQVNVYEDYEEVEITITNNNDKTICLTGNKYVKNIYLQNRRDTAYSSFNSEFDSEEIIMEAKTTKTFTVTFNKSYSVDNKAIYLVLSDIILDYEDYLQSEDKHNYWNRTSIKMNCQK